MTRIWPQPSVPRSESLDTTGFRPCCYDAVASPLPTVSFRWRLDMALRRPESARNASHRAPAHARFGQRSRAGARWEAIRAPSRGGSATSRHQNQHLPQTRLSPHERPQLDQQHPLTRLSRHQRPRESQNQRLTQFIRRARPRRDRPPEPRMEPRRPASSRWARASSRSASLEKRYIETPGPL